MKQIIPGPDEAPHFEKLETSARIHSFLRLMSQLHTTAKTMLERVVRLNH